MPSVVTTSSPRARVSATSAGNSSSSSSTHAPPPPSNSSIEDKFFWTYTEEPHRSRRQAIIKAHPEVTKLCGVEPLTKYVVLGVVSLQVACAYLLRNTPVLSWQFLLTGYVIGATANQNLFLAIHEISHNLAFKSPFANRLLAVFANLPIGIPYTLPFNPSQIPRCGLAGHGSPYRPRSLLPRLRSRKGLLLHLPNPLLRPTAIFIYSPPFTSIHLLNIIVQFTFDYCLYKICDSSLQPIYYLILSSFLAGSLHPCAGHFIAEHYFFSKTGAGTESIEELRRQKSGDKQTIEKPGGDALANLPPPETYSYYGPLNILTYNVGLHNEHHDFPAVPWTRLPTLHNIAKEFYEPLPSHRSWVWVIYTFILDSNVGLWCRVKRAGGGRIVGGGGVDGGGWKESEIQN
ncbi:sphingolipid delta-4 desaturase [Blastomyces gilchristii SLH14081]|uniref:Sphingolipid delta-4 desaturase n=1 Tax=Blastomyces gilchristii (strain SLH14081) TaxID=559298 RepID=A0A179UT89_BLAGS|nr:sphingolipid delta-4 desaturase [Blastomyces gilchristii SLH14081]OAT11316.1 sphingolipid delta-4 desaturase [Blastomyces gilchristii SLH14081]